MLDGILKIIFEISSNLYYLYTLKQTKQNKL